MKLRSLLRSLSAFALAAGLGLAAAPAPATAQTATCDETARAAYEAAKAALQAAMSREAAAAAVIEAQRQILATSTSMPARALAEQTLAAAVAEHAAAQVERTTAQVVLHNLVSALGTCLSVGLVWISLENTADAAEWHPPPPTSTIECMAAEELIAQFQAQLAQVQMAQAANQMQCAAGNRDPEVCAELAERYRQQIAELEDAVAEAEDTFQRCIDNLDPSLDPEPAAP